MVISFKFVYFVITGKVELRFLIALSSPHYHLLPFFTGGHFLATLEVKTDPRIPNRLT